MHVKQSDLRDFPKDFPALRIEYNKKAEQLAEDTKELGTDAFNIVEEIVSDFDDVYKIIKELYNDSYLRHIELSREWAPDSPMGKADAWLKEFEDVEKKDGS